VATRITDAVFLELVGRIYDAVCEPARWPDFLRALACAIEGRGTAIFTHNFETMEASVMPDAASVNTMVGFDPQFMMSYEQYFSHVNVWGMNEPELRTGRAVTGAALFPVQKLPKTEWYNDWLRPQDYFHLVGGVVVRDGAWATHFSSLRGRRMGVFSPEQVRLCQELFPHLARAVRIQRRFTFLKSLSESSFAVLDTVPAAVLLLNASRRVLHSNAGGETELRRGDPFRLGASGEICVRGQPRAQSSLCAVIAAALNPIRGVHERVPTVAQIARRNGELLSVQAVPLPRCDRSSSALMVGPQPAACALVVHGGTSVVPSIGPQLLRHVYGLTPAEVQIARAIAEGRTLKEYAERRRISRNTAASQLKRVFEKTGLKRQSELVRWLLLCGASRESTDLRTEG
jgi:DNA-binding CsgD family transcriptional regulator